MLKAKRIVVLLNLLLMGAVLSYAQDNHPWVTYHGIDGPGKGRNIVLVSGDEEYRSEEALPMLAQILAKRYGFTCTVLFSTDPRTGEIDAMNLSNINGLQHLQKADLLVISTRFRELPDSQMRYIDEYVRAGKPVIGLRTATHAFHYEKDSGSAYARYDFQSKIKGWENGFGKLVLGETWVAHHGLHKEEGTRGLINGIEQDARNPILSGVEDIWTPTDVYTVGPLPQARVLIYGQSTAGMTSTAPVNLQKSVMPVAWTRNYRVPGGKEGRAFATTMGAAIDLLNEDLRRLLVNACFWAMGMEKQIPEKADVNPVSDYKPTMFGTELFRKGSLPSKYYTSSPFFQVKMENVPIAAGIFQPDWKQVGDHYKTPAWFNEAKFGIWIHWGAQAMGRSGDWFAKFMYYPFGDWTLNGAYQNHLHRWGHPSVSGYKEVLKDWKAEKWDPERIMQLYKESGAKYVLILGAHHDNFDNWNSKYQPWNSVNIGPHRDIVGEWIKAAKAEGLRYGVSFHADYSWWWWQGAFTTDSTGDKKGIPYDAARELSSDTGVWKGYPLKDLYGLNLQQEIPAGKDPRHDFFSFVPETIKDTAYARWYCTKWCNRVKDLIDHYNPDILYFDGNSYPFSGEGTGRGFRSDATIRMAAHFYNQNMKKNKGRLEALLFTKGNEDPRAISSTHESNVPDSITDHNAWMSENSVGEWFYKPHTYYSTGMILHQMIEAFSHGGNYTINFQISAEGELDEEGIKTLKEIGRWMKSNGEAVYGSTAWKITGEGKTKMPDGNLRKEQDVSFTAEDIRFTTHKGALYAFVMSCPSDHRIIIRTLAIKGAHTLPHIKTVTMLGSKEKLDWKQTSNGLEVSYLTSKPDRNAFVLKITDN